MILFGSLMNPCAFMFILPVLEKNLVQDSDSHCILLAKHVSCELCSPSTTGFHVAESAIPSRYATTMKEVSGSHCGHDLIASQTS